jgi:putative phosphoribosyl transferase
MASHHHSLAARRRRPGDHRRSQGFSGPVRRGVCIEAAGARLAGELCLPHSVRGLAVFASGRGLGRLDRRQVNLAESLNARGIGTLLFDLVETTGSAETERDVGLLTKRLLGATDWSARQWGVGRLPIAYIGTGLGSSAALSAAGIRGSRIFAVASHSGRPDLAGDGLKRVTAPTLLVVEAGDRVLVQAAEQAAAQLCCSHRLGTLNPEDALVGAWRASPTICRWLEWHQAAHLRAS